MRVETRQYKHFGACIWLQNGVWELGIPLCFGARIIYFSLAGKENVFYEQPEDAAYLTTPEGWRIYGGTRLWLAPENEHALYAPERRPVDVAWRGETLVITQLEDVNLHAVKQIEICETDDKHSVRLTYRIRNVGSEALVGAPWAVSAMREGGVLTVPFGAERDAITAKPERVLSLWNNTAMNDPRLRFGCEMVEISQRAQDEYFKIGLLCRSGEARYTLSDQVFTKTFPTYPGAAYPDGGVNLEVYACRWMLEFETLAPLQTILPGQAAEHVECWTIQEKDN